MFTCAFVVGIANWGLWSYVSCRDEMSLNDGYGCFDFFISNKRQIFPPQNDENRLKIWPFFTKLWLFECRYPSKCTSEKTSFKVKEQNSMNYRRNKENDPLQECFPTCWCQICTETFWKKSNCCCHGYKNFPLKIVIFQILSNFSEIWYSDSVFDPEEKYVKSFSKIWIFDQ